MKVTVDGKEVVIRMAKPEAKDMMIFLASESRRRRAEFEAKRSMQCWPCLDICESMIKGLWDAGIKEGKEHKPWVKRDEQILETGSQKEDG